MRSARCPDPGLAGRSPQSRNSSAAKRTPRSSFRSLRHGYNIVLGKRVYINVNCVFLDVAPIRIGSDTLIGPASTSMRPRIRSTPRSDALAWSRAPVTHRARRVDRRWCHRLPGRHDGAGSVIGAGVVVVRSILRAWLPRAIPVASFALSTRTAMTRDCRYGHLPTARAQPGRPIRAGAPPLPRSAARQGRTENCIDGTPGLHHGTPGVCRVVVGRPRLPAGSLWPV